MKLLLAVVIVLATLTASRASLIAPVDQLVNTVQPARLLASGGGLFRSPVLRTGEDFPSDEISPREPAASLPSTNTLFSELFSWNDLAAFANLLDRRRIPLSEGPYVVLAPINRGFVELLLSIGPDQAFFNVPEEIPSRLEDTFLDSGLLDDILAYHVILGNFTEQELVDRGTVTTLQGAEIEFSPTMELFDNDPTQARRPKYRIYRSIETFRGRLMMINQVLLPFNLSAVLEGSGLSDVGTNNTFPSHGPGPLGLGSGFEPQLPGGAIISARVEPWRSFHNFIIGRQDMLVLNALFLIYGARIRSIIPLFGQKHFFAPTDIAFLGLFNELFGGNARIDSEDPVPGIIETFAPLFSVLRGIGGIPTLPEVLLYHVVNSSGTYESFIGQGQQKTFLANSTVSVTDDGIIDNDPSRGPSKRIASYPTFEGWVTVIDSVLLPIDSGIAAAVINANVNATAGKNCPPEPEDDGSCFAGDAVVKMSNGRRVRMADLQAGDEVHVDAKGTTSKIYLFTHRSPTLTRFTEVETENGRTIRLTPGHYLYANGRLVTAGKLVVGDTLETENGSDRVKRIGTVVRRGRFAPHSVHGDLMVDGIRVSAYTKAVAPRLAHAILAPVRAATVWGGVTEPFGSLLYDGIAEQWLKPVTWLFGGSERY